ncbi:3001_t:CDS:1, partial [Dentiscutata heterogama]
SDAIIRAGEGQNMREFRAHSLILNARSTYFKRSFYLFQSCFFC